GAIDERLRFLDWHPDDASRLNAAADRVQASQARFVEHFHELLARFPELARLLGDEETRTRLRRSQGEYFERLWKGPYDYDYVIDRLRVGRAHQRVGMDTPWYLGGYRLYLQSMLDTLLGDHPNAPLFGSLLKAVFFDTALAIDIY